MPFQGRETCFRNVDFLLFCDEEGGHVARPSSVALSSGRYFLWTVMLPLVSGVAPKR